MASKRKLQIIRAAQTQATAKYAVGGRLKGKPRPPITLAGKIRPRGRRGW